MTFAGILILLAVGFILGALWADRKHMRPIYRAQKEVELAKLKVRKDVEVARLRTEEEMYLTQRDRLLDERLSK